MSEETASGGGLIDHLIDLKNCLKWVMLYIIIGFGVAWMFSEKIFELIYAPILPFIKAAGGEIVFKSPPAKFIAHMKVSFFAGAVMTCPLWLHQVWNFISPGLYKNEKRYAAGFIFSGTFLFACGIAMIYFVVYPQAFDFLMNFGGTTDKPFIDIAEYISFFITTMFMFGLAFNLPLILTLLGMMGIVDSQFLKKQRRYAIVLIAVGSAVITPPDPASMVLFMIPMLVLYEVSVISVKIFGKKPELI